MKKYFKWLLGTTVLVVFLMSMPGQEAKAQPGVSVSFGLFYDELAPHGQWIDDPDYGYVWTPRERNFRPYYSGGHWAYTDYGNTWVSDYDWGWAPFHYGRWTYDDYYGWVWIPGDEWGPAWVTWRQGGGNYGWAPMGPSISISVSFGPRYNVPNDWWVFVPDRYIYANSYNNYYRGPQYNTTIIHNTTIINNTYNNTYVYGPRRNEVERAIGRKVNVYNIRNEGRPSRTIVKNNEINIYRPDVRREPRAGVREAPKNAIRSERAIGRNNEKNAVERNRSERGTLLNRNDRSKQIERKNEERGNQQRTNGIQRNEQRKVEIQGQPARVERERIQQNQKLEQNRTERLNQERVQRQQEQQRIEKNRVDQRQQQERAQRQQEQQRQQQQKVERQQPQRDQQKVERVQKEWKRPEPQRQAQPERAQPQKVERQQSQRIQSPQPQRQAQPQRVERMQPQRQAAQPQRVERPQQQKQERPQRVEKGNAERGRR